MCEVGRRTSFFSRACNMKSRAIIHVHRLLKEMSPSVNYGALVFSFFKLPPAGKKRSMKRLKKKSLSDHHRSNRPPPAGRTQATAAEDIDRIHVPTKQTYTGNTFWSHPRLQSL
jgi:hypothetical protein